MKIAFISERKGKNSLNDSLYAMSHSRQACHFINLKTEGVCQFKVLQTQYYEY